MTNDINDYKTPEEKQDKKLLPGQVMAEGLAQQEVQSWLDYKRVSAKKRASYQDAIDTLVDALAYGRISIAEDNRIVHTLNFPLEGFADKLEYKPRITVEAVQQATQAVKLGDAEGRILAYASALTGQAIGVLKKLDTEDNTICQAIAIFFL